MHDIKCEDKAGSHLIVAHQKSLEPGYILEIWETRNDRCWKSEQKKSQTDGETTCQAAFGGWWGV